MCALLLLFHECAHVARTSRAHHVNACIKSDGEAVGLTDNPTVLRRWMVAGLEAAALI